MLEITDCASKLGQIEIAFAVVLVSTSVKLTLIALLDDSAQYCIADPQTTGNTLAISMQRLFAEMLQDTKN